MFGNVVKPCIHCRKSLTLSRWESWNGFLVRCPQCGGLHGKHWNIKRVLFASILFHELSFPFTMRPRTALIAVVSFALIGLIGNYAFLNRADDLIGLAGASIFLLSPVVINAAILVKHEHEMDQSVTKTRI
jgi:hypothetical protein